MLRITPALLLGAVLLSAAPALAQMPRQPDEFMEDEQPDEGPAPARAFKLCAGVSLNPFWRDTIPVPDSWTIEDCREHVYTSFGSAVQAQLGCVFGSGRPKVSWSGIGAPGSVPPRNCGWRR